MSTKDVAAAMHHHSAGLVYAQTRSVVSSLFNIIDTRRNASEQLHNKIRTLSPMGNAYK